MNSIDTTRSQTLLFPLDAVPLETSDTTNNRDVFEDTDGSSKYSYLIEKGTDNILTLPADNGIGISTRGQPIFPVYNNNGQYTTPKCEVDSCNEHVGQGGGSPHFHGDFFGTCAFQASGDKYRSRQPYRAKLAYSHEPLIPSLAVHLPSNPAYSRPSFPRLPFI